MTSIVVDDRYADTVDNDGLTLIPPTLAEFAETFSDDLSSSLGLDLEITNGSKAEKDSIYFTIGNINDYKDVAGRNTSEGYSLDVTSEGITITGASPLGAWWATRTILQQALLGDSEVPLGSGSNAPGWGSRGFFVSWRVPSLCNFQEEKLTDILSKARCWAALVLSRVPDRDVFLALVLEAEHFPCAPE